MGDDQIAKSSATDAELEREVRAERKFTISEAIGRLAGPGMMKGVSPVARSQQAVAEIQEYLDRNLADTGGVLRGVVLRFVRESDLLLPNLDRPLAALSGWIRRILGSEHGLKELVRETDVEWGRVFGERPCFEREGQQPDPNDPYTMVSVRAALTELVQELPA